MPIAIAICDNEKNIRGDIMRLIKNQCADCHVEIFDSANALLAANKDYDIYILGIHMPEMDGIKTAEQIRARQEAQSPTGSVIIFITAHNEYIDAAFEVNAFHYFIKPIDENKFITVLTRAINNRNKIKEDTDKHILLKNGNSYNRIFLKDIYYIESHNKKVVINLADNAIEYYGTMQDFENTVGSAFIRCHRCYIVNMEHITRYNAHSIQMKNGAEILIARKKYTQFVKAFAEPEVPNPAPEPATTQAAPESVTQEAVASPQAAHSYTRSGNIRVGVAAQGGGMDVAV